MLRYKRQLSEARKELDVIRGKSHEMESLVSIIQRAWSQVAPCPSSNVIPRTTPPPLPSPLPPHSHSHLTQARPILTPPQPPPPPCLALHPAVPSTSAARHRREHAAGRIRRLGAPRRDSGQQRPAAAGGARGRPVPHEGPDGREQPAEDGHRRVGDDGGHRQGAGVRRAAAAVGSEQGG